MKILSKLFGSSSKVKIMRLFLYHPLDVIEAADVARRTSVAPNIVRSTLTLLKGIGFVKRKTVSKKSKKKGRDGKVRVTTQKVRGWALDDTFPYLSALRGLLVSNANLDRKALAERMGKVGQIKLFIISGVFLNQTDSRVDLFIVGNRINKKKLTELVKSIEAEMGKEVRYALFSQSDFHYRLNMFDKFIRDVLETTHEKLINRLESLE